MFELVERKVFEKYGVYGFDLIGVYGKSVTILYNEKTNVLAHNYSPFTDYYNVDKMINNRTIAIPMNLEILDVLIDKGIIVHK